MSETTIINEREKELNVLYALSMLFGQQFELQDIYASMPDVIVASALHPERSHARLRIGEKLYESTGFEEGSLLCERPLTVFGNEAGALEIHAAADATGPGDVPAPYDSAKQMLYTVMMEYLSKIMEIRIREAALQASEIKYRTMLSNLNLGVYRNTAGERGRFVEANQACIDMFGYDSLEEFCGISVAELYQPGFSRADYLEEIERTGAVRDRELRLQTRDGKPLIVSCNAVAHRNDEGVIDYIDGVLQDVTQAKRDQAELDRMRTYLRNIIDSMPAVLMAVDPNGLVTEWNLQAERSTGIPAEKAKGAPFDKVFPLLRDQRHRLRTALETKEPEVLERVLHEVDGKTLVCNVTLYPLVANGVRGAVITVEDVTERVRIQDMMVQTEKMMSVGGLAAGMAHEINNPLGGIMQGVQNVQRRFSADLAKNVQVAEALGVDLAAVRAYMDQRQISRFLDGIHASGARAAEIVQNMLQFSRRSDSKMVPTNLIELVDRTVDLAATDYDLKKSYDFRHIEIVRDYEPEFPIVIATPTEIEQVVLNLLKNAAQAMHIDDGQTGGGGEAQPPRGKPTITLRIRRHGEMGRLEISDNGKGMDEETRANCLNPFFTTKPVGIGTGLGLSVSYFIITNNHRGAMTVESEPGVGTTFAIELPLRREKP